MYRKLTLLLISLLVFPIYTLAGDTTKANLGYAEIEAAERQIIIKELTYRLNTKKNCNPVQKWSDKGSGADIDGYFFIPDVEENHFMIGGLATQSRKESLCVVTVIEPKENPENTPPLLVAPKDWKLIWIDKGSGAEMNGSMWEAVPPDGNYKCLGTVPQTGYEKPYVPHYRCVHASLTEKVTTSAMAWSEKGSHADKKVTMFRLPNTKSFVAVAGRHAKVDAYDLKPDASSTPDPKLVEEKLAARMEKIKQDLEAGLKEEAEQKKQAEKAEQQRLTEEAEKKRLADEAEQKRLAEEAEKKQKAEAAKQQALAEAKEQKPPVEETVEVPAIEEEPIQVVVEPDDTTAVTEEKTVVAEVDDNESNATSRFMMYLLKVFLTVLGIFIVLGFIGYKIIKSLKRNKPGTE